MATAAKDLATKPRTRKSAAAVLPALAPTSITPIPYGRLKRAPQNVRKTDIAADVESLADDIAAHGLLQSLIGFAGTTTIDAQAVYIVGGGRRLQALQLLRERGTIKDSWPVPVLIRPEEEAIELSLSENLARRDMNPADEFVAFAALMAPGNRSPADLAKQFGFTERYVKQRLRLAGLAEEILDALRQGQLTLDAAMAYAKASDKTLQLKVFKVQAKSNWRPHDPVSIGQAYINEQMLTSDPVFRFVGADDYEKKGGAYEDDLFDLIRSPDAPRKVIDWTIVTTTGADRAHFQLVGIKADAQAQHPTLTDVLLCPGLRAYGSGQGKAPKAPDGYVLAQPDTYWNAIDHDQRWKNADKNRVLIVGIAGIEADGKLRLLKDFFVPKDQLRTVCPVKESTGYRQQSQAEIDAQNRTRDIHLQAARAAVGPFAGTRLEGRGYWPSRGYVEQAQKVSDPELGDGVLIAIQLFVSNAEIEANLAEGERRVDEAAAAEATRLAAKKAEQEASAAAIEARWKDLCAADPAPEVLLTVDGDLWVKGPQGWAVDGEEDGDNIAEDFRELLEVLDPGYVEGWWTTRADYDAHRAQQDGEGGQ